MKILFFLFYIITLYDAFIVTPTAETKEFSKYDINIVFLFLFLFVVIPNSIGFFCCNVRNYTRTSVHFLDNVTFIS